jgi:hypothetical protein
LSDESVALPGQLAPSGHLGIRRRWPGPTDDTGPGNGPVEADRRQLDPVAGQGVLTVVRGCNA